MTSALAKEYCIGRGLEIGGAAHNAFGLNTLNVDVTAAQDTIFKKEEKRICGHTMPVDIVAPGDDIPLSDDSQDFVVSSHVLEHFHNPIKALLEWQRLVRPGGIIFMIVPHKERTFDRNYPRTPLAHLIDDYERGQTGPVLTGHQHYWIMADVVELVEWMKDTLNVKWDIVKVQDPDDKVGNGFTVVIRKI